MTLIIIAIYMVLMGLGIAVIWTRDIIANPEIDVSRGIARAREPDSGPLLFPHWIAEYGTAAGLIAGAVGMLLHARWGLLVSLAALGSLTYTSINSLGWALARPERWPYAVPMFAGAAGGVACIIMLMVI